MSSAKTILKTKASIKYLGIMTNLDVSFKNHIDFICHQIVNQ